MTSESSFINPFTKKSETKAERIARYEDYVRVYTKMAMMTRKPHPAYMDGWNDAMRLRDRQTPAPAPQRSRPFGWVIFLCIALFQLLISVTVYNCKK